MLGSNRSGSKNGTDDSLLVSGFGKFCVKQKNARRGGNPATDQTDRYFRYVLSFNTYDLAGYKNCEGCKKLK
ncbi:MAG: HU family DNA-binding protein [Deltaproteobacteria bacterium]|nr:HU family DNA-binding protein [Deltaproteobacteria bacterium]